MGYGSERRFCCPFEECGDKRKDAGHRSLCVSNINGAFYCHRCGNKGQLDDYKTKKKKTNPWHIITDAEMDEAFELVLEQMRMRDLGYEQGELL